MCPKLGEPCAALATVGRQSGNQKVLVSPTVSQRTPAKQNHGVDRDDGDGRRSSVRGAPLGTQAKDRNRIRMQAQEQANSSAEGLPKRHLGNFKRNKSTSLGNFFHALAVELGFRLDRALCAPCEFMKVLGRKSCPSYLPIPTTSSSMTR